MSSILRTLLISAVAVPAFALAVEDMNGTWQVNGEATWAEMAKNPQFAKMPKEQIDMMKPMMMAQLTQVRFIIAGGTITVTKPGEKSDEKAKVKSWTSTGPTSATAMVAGNDGQEKPTALEKPDAKTLRMTIEEQGQKMTMVFTVATDPVATAPAPGSAPTPAPTPAPGK